MNVKFKLFAYVRERLRQKKPYLHESRRLKLAIYKTANYSESNSTRGAPSRSERYKLHMYAPDVDSNDKKTPQKCLIIVHARNAIMS